ncbi:hypothetical protein KFZ70_09025 [Tamlana fucoidanivorans]|uniref:Uncharacterized protein n=1 Tax=Allotamlana fucoidanivorans TaxID=2583814 RepID=A0A5C4SPA9_9FLAO|nr:hypothetical protein [Tamlana fucoidanivorans]TNJ46098.1 hypothetical protein FGF67_03655 [Tamlana fucoidanivorans]
MKNIKTIQFDFGFKVELNLNNNIKTTNSKKAQEDLVFELMDSLTSPIIVYKSAWQDAIPKDLLSKITISRMICQLKREKMASITEVVAYMMPRTFEAPLPSEWVNIYTWCGFQYATIFNNQNQRKEMKEAMLDIIPEKLSDHEQGLLKYLRIWIYDKRRKALKAKLKEVKRIDKHKPVKIQEKLFEE